MHRLQLKDQSKSRRKDRIRKVVKGTSARPRLSVFISHMHVTAQIIDDTSGKTIAYATSIGQKDIKGNLTQVAEAIGITIGQKAKSAKVKKVAFDRNGRMYHGRLKALAEAARKEGLEF